MMLIPLARKALRDGTLKTACAVLISTALFCTLPAAAGALVDPIPKEIKDVTMGLPAESVIQKIKESGSHTTEPIVEENRSRLVWIPARSPHYKDVIFGFTEQGRLFQIRFNLTAPARSNAAELKKAFLQLFDFYHENPVRLRVKDSDVILYGPGKNNQQFLIEFSDRNTGQKSFELFDRDVSAADRPLKPKTEEAAPGTAATDIPSRAAPSPAEKSSPQAPPPPATTDSALPPAGTK